MYSVLIFLEFQVGRAVAVSLPGKVQFFNLCNTHKLGANLESVEFWSLFLEIFWHPDNNLCLQTRVTTHPE
jgi:hypothetical protein